MAQDNPTTTERKLRQEREAGFEATTDRNRAVAGNLQTSLRGAGRAIGAENARILGKMENMRMRMDMRRRQTGAIESELVNRYGGLFQAPAHQALRGRVREDVVGQMQGRMFSDAVDLQTKAGQSVLASAQAGASEAASAAQYATAQALAARTKEDVRLVAEMRHEIELAKIQAAAQEASDERQFQNQLALLDRAEAKDLATLQAQSPMAVEVGSTIIPYSSKIRSFIADNPNLTSGQEVISAMAEAGLMEEGDEQNAAVTALAQNILTTPGLAAGEGSTRAQEIDAIADAAMVTIASQYPDLASDASVREALERRIKRDLIVQYSGAGGGGGGGGGTGYGHGGEGIGIPGPMDLFNFVKRNPVQSALTAAMFIPGVGLAAGAGRVLLGAKAVATAAKATKAGQAVVAGGKALAASPVGRSIGGRVIGGTVKLVGGRLIGGGLRRLSAPLVRAAEKVAAGKATAAETAAVAQAVRRGDLPAEVLALGAGKQRLALPARSVMPDTGPAKYVGNAIPMGPGTVTPAVAPAAPAWVTPSINTMGRRTPIPEQLRELLGI